MFNVCTIPFPFPCIIWYIQPLRSREHKMQWVFCNSFSLPWTSLFMNEKMKKYEKSFRRNNEFIASTKGNEICWRNTDENWMTSQKTFDTFIQAYTAQACTLDQSKSLRCFNDLKLVMQNQYINISMNRLSAYV